MSGYATAADYDSATKLCAMCILALQTTHLLRKKEGVDAIAVFSGLGITAREKVAIEGWNHGALEARFLLFAGGNPGKGYDHRLTIERLQEAPYYLKKIEGVYTQIETQNTKTQATWVAEMAKELGAKSIGLVVSPWHAPRALLTQLKANVNEGIKIPIIILPSFEGADFVTPESGTDEFALIPGEMKRILQYQEKGDVATFEEAMDYFRWLWTESGK